MATLAVHTTLDIMIKTISDLEARVIELKKAANMLAANAGLDMPYLGVEIGAEKPTRIIDFGTGPSSDAQD